MAIPVEELAKECVELTVVVGFAEMGENCHDGPDCYNSLAVLQDQIRLRENRWIQPMDPQDSGGASGMV